MHNSVLDGHVVTIRYRLSLEDETIVEDTFEEEPVVYIHGKGQLVPGLERGLVGLKAGNECQISVAPRDGYGLRDAAAPKSVPRDEFPAGEKLTVGMSLQARGPDGVLPVWIQSVDEGTITITSNHPLAGHNLTYDVKVLGVREATPADHAPPET